MILDILIKLLTKNNIEVITDTKLDDYTSWLLPLKDKTIEEVITEAIVDFCIYYKITKVNINKAYLDKHRNRLVIKLKVII